MLIQVEADADCISGVGHELPQPGERIFLDQVEIDDCIALHRADRWALVLDRDASGGLRLTECVDGIRVKTKMLFGTVTSVRTRTY